MSLATKSVGKPDAGNPQVRFDERGGETGRLATPQATAPLLDSTTQGYEPWSAELEVFRNPFAQHPLPRALLPAATHWFETDGEVVCKAHYETQVLWSKTLIQNDSDPMLTLGDDLRPPVESDV